ncbi:MAG: hypothetical protein CMD78_00115 [Gammaproteobacteria bacterium]|nr:hypothetical protein [Gammaproteobacteria bacterium]|tara:strand:+ start:833 stop:1147 length:315 start_codon:yes stop_codon:yes gene_type:complete
MKDIKTFLIGFLTCACLFLVMGQTMSQGQIDQMKNMASQMKNAGLMPEPIGKYQGFSDKGELYLVNTITGQLFYEKKQKGENVWKQMIADNKRYGPTSHTKHIK